MTDDTDANYLRAAALAFQMDDPIRLRLMEIAERLPRPVCDEVDSLRDALLKVLDTREKEAKAWFASQNAKENLSDRGVKEERLHLAAMTTARNAEKEARLLLATLKRSNVRANLDPTA